MKLFTGWVLAAGLALGATAARCADARAGCRVSDFGGRPIIARRLSRRAVLRAAAGGSAAPPPRYGYGYGYGAGRAGAAA